MAVFQLGPVIRSRREELGLTQEDLADGICSVPTLSRIENGERMPTKNHFDMLMQRLGYSSMHADIFTDWQDFEINEIKERIRRTYIAGDFSHARKFLVELESMTGERTQIDRQFLLLYQVILYEDNYTNEEKLSMFETALRLTCPGYCDSRIPSILSYEEIILLNNIAVSYDLAGDRDRAIAILKSLKMHYDSHLVSSEEAVRTQPMILYNLSKCLGQAGQYSECIDVCDSGIRLARITGRCHLLCLTLYNRAWALYNRNQPGDKESSQYSMAQAYHFAQIMGNENEMQYCISFWNKNFPEIKLN